MVDTPVNFVHNITGRSLTSYNLGGCAHKLNFIIIFDIGSEVTDCIFQRLIIELDAIQLFKLNINFTFCLFECGDFFFYAFFCFAYLPSFAVSFRLLFKLSISSSVSGRYSPGRSAASSRRLPMDSRFRYKTSRPTAFAIRLT